MNTKKTKKRCYKIKRKYYKKNGFRVLIVVTILCAITAFMVSWSANNWSDVMRRIEVSVVENYFWNRGVDANVRIDERGIQLEIPYQKIGRWRGKDNTVMRRGVFKATFNPREGTIKGTTEEDFNVYGDNGRREISGDSSKVKIKFID